MADILDHLHEARRLDAQQRHEREQRWTLPTTAEGWEDTAHRLALMLRRHVGCLGLLDGGRPCIPCQARAVVRYEAQQSVAYAQQHGDEPGPYLRRDAHLRAPCLDHDAMRCPDPHCTGAIGDGSHDLAPPTCDTCSVTWGRCTRCETVHDHERDCPGCAADERGAA